MQLTVEPTFAFTIYSTVPNIVGQMSLLGLTLIPCLFAYVLLSDWSWSLSYGLNSVYQKVVSSEMKGEVSGVYESMTKEQVMKTLIKSFPKLMLKKPQLFNATLLRNSLRSTFDGFPTGEEVIEISSKESMYIVEGGLDIEQVLFVLDKVSPDF